MLPPPCQGGIVFEQVELSVNSADSGGSEDLVSGEDVEIAVEGLHIRPHVGDSLCAIDQHTRPVAMRHLDHLARGCDRAEGVRHMAEWTRSACAGSAVFRTLRG